ncbi:MAG: methylenetetrahydrofolate reductase, partial [Pseudomonadota bacterium]|nr:methylenetetrahydrofolate reductase [Pseudomonadota bacterium]
MESQKQFKRRFSFEFFPPKTDQGKEKLQTVRNQLAEVNPDFFSVTFGAGGSTRDR